MEDLDKELVRRARLGDKDAFAAIYEHNLPRIYRFIYFKTANRATAEEITQEVFLAALRAIPRYHDEGFLVSSWLYEIARNKVIDFYRSKKSDISIDEELEERPELTSTDFVKTMETKIEADKLKNLLKKLPEDYQNIILLRFVEDLSNEEVAHSLGKSLGAVRVLQHRALKALRKLVE
ncbi:MAG: sigma-70 family RNA polymerase sigma factor [Candidatus Harrisonbacteria bacterium]|nr:sigma-70 family RNA polymerase sigma factor [Candidatus Harrisonbacteria bacterium]